MRTPDYWIAKYNVSHIEQLTCADLEYMMCNLSLDAAPIIAEIDPKEVSSDDTSLVFMVYRLYFMHLTMKAL